MNHPSQSSHPELPRLRGKVRQHAVVFVLFLLGLSCFAAGLAIVVYEFSFVEWRKYEFPAFILGSSCMEFIALFLIATGFGCMKFALEPEKLFPEKGTSADKDREPS
ncbi:MAG: hypothetical protein LBO79_10120 [Zoogloeaceae bacterium]|jgi:hypothetical protein|nr:hypothetical protein [Zoogloeaceae bacterium]